MTFKHLMLPLLCLLLMSCGGGGGDSDTPKEPPPPSATPPVVTLSVDSASIDESSTVVIIHSAKDYQDTIIASELNCDVGILDGNNYTAPSVATETTATCTATATDNGNRSSTETLTLTINAVTPVLALANGETSTTTAKLTTIDVSFADVSEGLIDATLNGDAIKLAITPDKQLVYFPPMGATGIQTLELTIEGEVVFYEYQAQDSSSSFADAEIYINDFFTRMRNQIDIIIQDKIASNAAIEEVESLNTFKDSLSLNNDIFSSLTSNELEYFAQIIFENNDSFERVAKSASFYKSSRSSLLVSNRSSLTECESEALKTTVYVTSSVAIIGATAALVSSGGGTPWGLISGVAVIASGAVWADHVEDTIDICFEPFKTELRKLTTGSKSKVSSPSISSKVNSDNTLTFFSSTEKEFTAQTQNQYITGAEGFVTTIIDGYNFLSGKFNWLFDLAGRDNIPDYAENAFADELNVNDYLYTDINPSNLSVSAITDAGVTGGDITNINEDNSFDLTFNIEDLDVPHIAFQFTITDSGHDTPLSTVINAEVTLNPPIAYNETFAVVIGDDMTARLQADFETGFEIKTLPQKGTLNTDGAFSYPGGGLFTYTPDESITENTTDSFTFVATNGSALNNGESNLATVTIQVTAELDCSVYETHVLGEWSVSALEYPDQAPRKLVISEEGYGRYIIDGPNGANKSGIDENGDSYYNINWSIKKKNNMCYLSENGFWHFGYEKYRSFDPSLTDAHLEIPVSSFYRYYGYNGESSAVTKYEKK